MRKILTSLLLLTAFMWALPTSAATWAVTDTIIKDGYYRLWTYNGVSTSNKVKITTDWYAVLQEGGGVTDGWIINAGQKVTFNANDMAAVWHIWRAGDHEGHPTYHLKNMGMQAKTYILPQNTVAGTSAYLWGTGVEQDSVYIQTKNYGTRSKVTGYKARYGIFNVQFTANNYTDSATSDVRQLVMLTSTKNLSRWRLGDSYRYKLNPYSSVTNACFDLVPYDVTGKEEYMKLVEALTDAKGRNFQVGDNPGQVPTSQSAIFDNFDQVVSEAQDLADTGGAEDVCAAKAKQVREAIAAIEAACVSLDNGYFVLRNHVKYSTTNGAKFLHPLMDYAKRESLDGSDNIPIGDGYTDTTSMQAQFNYLFNTSWWLGYDYQVDATAENLPADFIWHVTKAADGKHYYLKNCAEVGTIGDSTYFHSTATYHGETAAVMDGRDYGDHNQMSGTAKFPYELWHETDNQYRLVSSQNPYIVNQGVENLCTDNTTNLTTYTLWEFETVPASRITPKFLLNESLTEAKGILNDWQPGNNPGNLKASISEPLQNAIDAAMSVYQNDGDFASAKTALDAVVNTTKALLKDTLNAVNPIEEGYYYFENYTNLTQRKYGDSTACTVFAGDDGYLHWASDLLANLENPIYAWKITPKGDGKYSICNLGTGKYIGSGHQKSGWVEMTDTDEVDQIISANNTGITFYESSSLFLGDCHQMQNVFTIANAETPTIPWHNLDHGAGANLGPNFVEQYVNAWTCWYYLNRITDQKTLDILLEKGAQKARNLDLYNALHTAQQANDKTVSYSFNKTDSLIYEAGVVHLTAQDGSDSIGFDQNHNQFDSNNKAAQEGAYRNLLDGLNTTFFITRYNTNSGAKPTEDGYLQVDLRDKPQQNFVFYNALRSFTNSLYGKVGGRPTTAYSEISACPDYGQRNRPKDYTITATNDTLNGPWTEVAYLNMSTNPNLRQFYSPLIQADQPYRFYRFSVHNTVNGGVYSGIQYWNVSEWQMYPAAVNETTSAYNYDSNIKTAADQVRTLIAQGWNEYKAGAATQETINSLNKATADLNAIVPDTSALSSRILEAQILNDSAYAYDLEENAQWGDVSPAQKATFEAAIATAKQACQPASQPSVASLQAAYNTLNDAYFTLNSQRKTFEVNKWYYLQSAERQSYHVSSNYAWRGGHFYYASGATAQPAIKADSCAYPASQIQWGHYVDFNGSTGLDYPASLGADVDYMGGHMDNEDNGFAMWRFVQLSDSVYAVQNRATGLYMGRRQDINQTDGNAVCQSVEPMKVAVNIIGRNQFEIMNIDSVNGTFYTSAANAKAGNVSYGDVNQPLHQQGSNFRAVWWGTGSESYLARGFNTGSAVTFVPVNDDDIDMLAYPAKTNNIEIKSYPFAVNGIVSNTGDAVNAYALKNIVTNVADSTFTAELTEKTAFAAGEPFVLITGNPNDESLTKDSITLYFDVPTGYELANKSVNGLTSVLYGDSILKPGIGVFVNAVLTVTDSTRAMVLGQTGFIQPAETKDAGGTADVTINGKGLLNAIESAVVDREGFNGNVYSIEGKLLRRDATNGAKGLQKGVYIINKKKVYVQ